ncbi:MAG: amylo-alpha-1,6-glucosidase, partial [Bryobacteraceae bacterium]
GFVWSGVYYERIRLRNFLRSSLTATIAIDFAADYRDIFEIRGDSRPRRGVLEQARADGNSVVLGYEGLDRVTRTTRIVADPRPSTISDSEMRFQVELGAGEERTLTLTASCRTGPESSESAEYDAALKSSNTALEKTGDIWGRVVTSNHQFNRWLDRSRADLNMMLTETGHGLFPYAGVPWFSTPFGRDGLITALECLWTAPAIARGVLSYLAATQAADVSAEQDSEPGKILHETRSGEMAALKEVPFGRYYGSVDSTPLFVMLAGAYYRRTGDLKFISSIWHNIDLALQWVDKYGDPDRDGFVEYHRKSAQGLVQQGWKDSQDSIFHKDGRLAEGPIALCEVQGYVFAAKLGAADLALRLGHKQQADDLRAQASRLKERFDERFWCEEIGSYGLALDGDKRLC